MKTAAHLRLLALLPALALAACTQMPGAGAGPDAATAGLRKQLTEQGAALERARAQAKQADARAAALERDLAAARRENAELKKQIEALAAIERSLSNRGRELP